MCPNCGEHSTIVRMSSTALYVCSHCRARCSSRSDEPAAGGRRALDPGRRLRRLGEQVGRSCSPPARARSTSTSWTATSCPPLTMGPPVVRGARGPGPRRRRLLDVHLMVERPERHVAEFAEGRRGRDHAPRRGDAPRQLRAGRRPRGRLPRRAWRSARARRSGGVGRLGDFDLLLCMTVNPGWGGQAFLPGSLDKIERLRALIGERRPRWRSTAASTPTPPARAPRPARRCSWPDRPIFGATTRGGAYRACGGRRPRLGVASRMGGQSPDPGPQSFTPDMACTVLIVDDHPSFRASARVRAGVRGVRRRGRGGGRRVRDHGVLPAAPGGRPARRAAPRHRRLRRLRQQITAPAGAPRRDPDLEPRQLRLRAAGHTSGARGFVPKAELSGERVQEL